MSSRRPSLPTRTGRRTDDGIDLVKPAPPRVELQFGVARQETEIGIVLRCIFGVPCRGLPSDLLEGSASSDHPRLSGLRCERSEKSRPGAQRIRRHRDRTRDQRRPDPRLECGASRSGDAAGAQTSAIALHPHALEQSLALQPPHERIDRTGAAAPLGRWRVEQHPTNRVRAARALLPDKPEDEGRKIARRRRRSGDGRIGLRRFPTASTCCGHERSLTGIPSCDKAGAFPLPVQCPR